MMVTGNGESGREGLLEADRTRLRRGWATGVMRRLFPAWVLAGVVLVSGSAGSALAQTAGDRKWEIEVSGGGAFSMRPVRWTALAASIEPGAPFTTVVDEPSRRVRSWFFGDGAALLNEAIGQFTYDVPPPSLEERFFTYTGTVEYPGPGDRPHVTPSGRRDGDDSGGQAGRVDDGDRRGGAVRVRGLPLLRALGSGVSTAIDLWRFNVATETRSWAC